MRRFRNWYKNLTISTRVILSMNFITTICIVLISIYAAINRVRVQKEFARVTVENELRQITDLLSFMHDKPVSELEEIINSRVLFNTGYISLVSSSGDVLVCPKRQGQNISSQPFFSRMKTNMDNEVVYTDARTGNINYQYQTFYEPLKLYVSATLEKKEFLDKAVRNTLMVLLFALIFTLITFTIAIYFIIKTVTNPIGGLVKVVKELGKGILSEDIKYESKDEVGQIAQSVNHLVSGLKRTTVFADEIRKQNFDHPFEPLSDQDVLGISLLQMRDSLKTASEEEIVRKVEDEKRNWTTHGLAIFAEILRRNNDNINELSYDIIKNLVDYLKINQGGVFILNDDNPNELYLEMTACYAYDRRKYIQKKILPGEGLVGTCFLERESIYITRVPQDYIRITSGLGGENPGSLLLIPLQVNEKIYGVIELASFEVFEPYQQSFVEKIGESIASTISSVKINTQTALLLQKSQLQAEEMKAQEEEMRQNMEELSATQEAMTEKERENMQAIENLIKENKQKIAEVKKLEKEIIETLEICPEAVVRINENGKIFFFNHAAEKLWGYHRQEVAKKNISMLMGVDTSAIPALLENVRATPGEAFPIEIKLKSGSRYWVDCHVSLTTSADENFITVFFKQPVTPVSTEVQASQGLDAVMKVKNDNKPAEMVADNPIQVAPGTGRSKDEGDTPASSVSGIEELNKGDVTDNQKAWTDHIIKKGKSFKKPKKK